MKINWENYELVLLATDHKECEVTGRDMGGTTTHVCPISKMVENKQVTWEPDYSGYQSVGVTFLGADDEVVRFRIYNGYNSNHDFKPGDEWSSGWYDFGSWSYHVKLKLQKIKEEDSKPFFVHTMTDDGVTSDYADAKEAYGER